MANQDCSNDIVGLTKNCMEYIKFPSNPKTAPSKECCEVVKKCDVKCVCDHVTKDIEKAICMEKVVYVADQCGRPLPKGSKCGSYEIPPSKMF
ncbi:hypothetical protein LUZ60_011178 [Juncus effusus]|nr:hypothetical protein LUZ60_011178 [Juncus effusus]